MKNRKNIIYVLIYFLQVYAWRKSKSKKSTKSMKKNIIDSSQLANISPKIFSISQLTINFWKSLVEPAYPEQKRQYHRSFIKRH